LYDFNLEEDDRQIVAVIQAHFAAIQNLVVDLVKEASPKGYEELAPLIMSLLSGSIVVAQVSRTPDIARINRSQAAALLAAKPKRVGVRRSRTREC
jgi:hypothetical protein